MGEVAIERPDGPVVDALLEAELHGVRDRTDRLKNLRGRYGSAGNKDDSFDAYVLADTLRTDRPRLHALTRDSEPTMTLRMTVRARQDLVAARVAMANQLRAHLQTTLPGAIGLFRDIDSAITLAFLTRFPSQDKADWLSRTRLGNWLRSVGYNHLAKLDQLWAHLDNAPAGTRGTEAAARAQIDFGSAFARAPARYEARSRHRRRYRHPQGDEHPYAAVPHRPYRCSCRPAPGRDRRRPRPLSHTGKPHPACPCRLSPLRQFPARSRSSPSAGLWRTTPRRRGRFPPATAITTTSGPPTSTNELAPAATTIPTPSGSWPVPGSTLSGAVGKTACPTTPPNTTPYNASSPRLLDTGLLTAAMAC